MGKGEVCLKRRQEDARFLAEKPVYGQGFHHQVHGGHRQALRRLSERAGLHAAEILKVCLGCVPCFWRAVCLEAPGMPGANSRGAGPPPAVSLPIAMGSLGA